MASTSRHLSEFVDRPVQVVYDYVSEAANLPEWAHGLVGSAALEHVEGQVLIHSPDGRVVVEFAPRNEYGVVDHWVTLPSGKRLYAPMRVIAHGDGAEVVFTLRREPEMTEAEFDRDSGLVAADLSAIKRVLEQLQQ